MKRYDSSEFKYFGRTMRDLWEVSHLQIKAMLDKENCEKAEES
jgi:hypothetical protein